MLLLLVLQSTVAKADDDKSKSKPKKETKYDRLFKDKKTETARSKFITVHKLDNKIYFELPRTLLKKQMMLGGVVTQQLMHLQLLLVQQVLILFCSILTYRIVL